MISKKNKEWLLYAFQFSLISAQCYLFLTSKGEKNNGI